MHTRHWPRHVLAAPPAPFLWHLRHGIKGAWEEGEGEGEGGEFYTGDGWRAALTETEDERAFARRERDAKETGQRDGDYAAGLLGGGKPTAYERNISLKNHPRTRCSRVPSGLSRSLRQFDLVYIQLSGIDSLAILPLTMAYLRSGGKKKEKKKKERGRRGERKGENR